MSPRDREVDVREGLRRLAAADARLDAPRRVERAVLRAWDEWQAAANQPADLDGAPQRRSPRSRPRTTTMAARWQGARTWLEWKDRARRWPRPRPARAVWAASAVAATVAAAALALLALRAPSGASPSGPAPTAVRAAEMKTVREQVSRSAASRSATTQLSDASPAAPPLPPQAQRAERPRAVGTRGERFPRQAGPISPVRGPIAAGGAWQEQTHVIRMRVQRDAAMLLGVEPSGDDETVEVDVLVGEDGVARGWDIAM